MRRQGTILVIDDEEIMREILETLLTREGYRVRLAASGPEGLEVARSTPIDAVIVDVMMPGMDGLQVLDAIRDIDDELPVLMITAFASMETAVTAFDPTTLNTAASGNFFVAAPYAGAFRNAQDTWFAGWTCGLVTGSLCTQAPANTGS